MNNLSLREKHESSSIYVKICFLMTLFVCFICAGCNVPKAEILLLRDNSDITFQPAEVKIYENFEQINGYYEILGKIDAGIVPVNSSTSAKRTKVLIEKASENGANGVVGLYDKEEFWYTPCHPRTTGILVHVADKYKKATVKRPAFIVKVLPVIWPEETRRDKKLKKIEEIMIARMHCDMRNKGYYSKPIELSQEYNVPDLESMDKNKLESLIGKETDYILVIESLGRKKAFLVLGVSDTAGLKASLFSVKNQKVVWSDIKSSRSLTGIVEGVMGAGEIKGAGVVKKTLKTLPPSELK